MIEVRELEYIGHEQILNIEPDDNVLEPYINYTIKCKQEILVIM